MNPMLFAALLVRNRLVDRLAFEDPEGWDGGVTESRAAAAYEELFPRPPDRQDGETPRTDAQCENNGIGLPLKMVSADFARTLERELSAKQAEIESLKAAQGWRPIETAPKDGTFLLMWQAIPEDCAQIPTLGAWFIWPSVTQGWRDDAGDPIDPTHWMPLPTPPVEQPPTGEENE